MTLKVSVVVAVYNTGPNLLQLMHSLDVQSLPRAEFEVLLVDDGSTDDTPALLREVARRRPHVRVHTIENSGWPGRPRNVGLAHARGEYVFFSDHDDEFFPYALEEMYDTARADDSDIVYGKVVRSGRPTPYWPLARADVAHARLVEHHLMESRSTHKLYRRRFLDEHGIRFLEGRVRLEDHHFMGQALAADPRVSVLASVPCYRWIHRNDGSNSSSGHVDLDWYFGFFRRSVELLQAPSLPSEVRLQAAAVGAERMFMAVPPRSWAARATDDRSAAVHTLAGFVDACVPPEADHRLGVIKRAAVAALRQHDLEAFDAVQELRRLIDARPTAQQVRWDGARLLVTADVDLLADLETVLTVEDVAGAPTLVPRSPVAERALPPQLRTLTGWEGVGSLELSVRRARSGLEWPLAQHGDVSTAVADGRREVRARVQAVLDADAGVFGQPLGPGSWMVMGRVELLGESRVRRLAVAPDVLPDSTPPDGSASAATAVASDAGQLGVTVGSARRPQAHAVRCDGDRLTMRLDPVTRPALVVARVRDGDAEVQPFTSAPVREGETVVELPRTAAGQIVDVSVVTPTGGDWRVGFGGECASRAPLRVYATTNGSLSVKHLATPERRGLQHWVRTAVRAVRARG
ncbi:glycosyltransferase family 2 protein [Angustibacter sp. Root456]|uniref:glycosyltransferase family 2 protein n=1 Tax=Angustibacter sp. Root456 TaxID=1736539 RepID=UPI0006FCD105|nr:glycosyltransferase family 2 protein [Angustibacter sp. Root456]KQX69926.1 hypothetical protein ASD06_02700 [Angustibacter sp. Root456]